MTACYLWGAFRTISGLLPPCTNWRWLKAMHEWSTIPKTNQLTKQQEPPEGNLVEKSNKCSWNGGGVEEWLQHSHRIQLYWCVNEFHVQNSYPGWISLQCETWHSHPPFRIEGKYSMTAAILSSLLSQLCWQLVLPSLIAVETLVLSIITGNNLHAGQWKLLSHSQH